MVRSLALVLLVFPAAAHAQYQETYVEEAPVLVDFGLQAEIAFSGLGDETSTSSGSYFALGGVLGAHIGVDINTFIALFLLEGRLQLQAEGDSSRGYAGIGPAALVGWRPRLDASTRLSMEIGAGFDYGVSAATDASHDDVRRVEGVFPTIHHRITITALDDDGLPLTFGFHFMAAIPTEAPNLYLFAATVIVGLRTM